ncbi:MAG: RHS repeat domain-containing protein [Thermoleophilia bacterium]
MPLTSYGYDPLNRLTSENIGGYGTISYGYDRAGNRTSLSNPTTGQTSYSYNEANELTSSLNNGATTDYSYNANGAVTSKTTGADTTNYSYNGMDKLTQVNTPSSTVNYAYDALGRRIERTEGSDTRNVHLQAKTDLPDYWSDASGNITASLLRGADGLISFTLDPVTNPNLSYQLYSPHGDTTMIMDTSGNPFFTARYDAFGNAISGSGLWYGYTGKYQRYSDSSTGTIEMGVREYDPNLGRFISQDPLKGTPADPQQRNRYQYVGNDPLTRYDLSGLVLGGDAWGWVKDRASDVNNFVHDPEHTAFTGYIPPEKRPFANNGFVQVLKSDVVGMGLLASLGLPGGFGRLGAEEGLGLEGSEICFNTSISIDNPESLWGASWDDVESQIPKDWERMPLRKGEGVRYLNPKKPGEAIYLEKGTPVADDPLHRGPYIKISRNGSVVRIPLEGNPALDE